MNFEKGYIYHIFNQGNNRQKIFFNRENDVFFLKKLQTYIIPYADILAWCLMPNHFHLMIYIKTLELPVDKGNDSSKSDTMTSSHRITERRSLNNSIAIMLRSYTRAVNIQENFSGSLFKAHSKSECVNCPTDITPSFITESGYTKIKNHNPENQYPEICFNYIHQNPVKAGLVNKDTDWEFSSAQDYAGIRKGKMVNKALAKKFFSNY